MPKITGSPTVDRPLQRIREFRNRPNPGIVVTVDMLTTGVDIPDLEFIVFLRPVKSRILFEQMLGRGTRKGEQATRTSPTSSSSTASTARCSSTSARAHRITAEPPERDGKRSREIIEDIWQNRDRDYNVRCLVKRLQRIDKEMSGEARELFAASSPTATCGRFAAGLAALCCTRLHRHDEAPARPRLPGSPRELPAAQRTFVVAHGAPDDVVSSEWLIRGRTGQEYKPADYLAAFAAFVQGQPRTRSQAISHSAVSGPRTGAPTPLSELRK